MRIANAQIQMAAAHQSTVRQEVRQRLTITVAAGQNVSAMPTPVPVPEIVPATPVSGDAVNLASENPSTDARTAMARNIRSGLRAASNGGRPAPNTESAPAPVLRTPGALRSHASVPTHTTTKTSGAKDGADDESARSEDMKTAIVRQLFERMTGKKMNIGDLEKALAKIHSGEVGTQLNVTTPGREAAGLAGDIEMPGPVAGLRFERIERTETSETTAFSARAVVTTAEGQEIEVGVDMVLSHRFVEENRIELTAGQVQGGPNGANGGKTKDPLVLNFDAAAASLTEGTVAFDIDSDGQKDDIHFLGEGSGFVALDKNGNGSVDDGSELFGATSGDGFAELAAYDDDGNGWIDEGDAVFDSLKVWSKDAAGNDSLASLKERNVGAIYLGKVTAPYAYKSNDSAENVAHMRSAGFYVGEIGHRAGSMQQLDLVV
jgi:hypothetical protein